MGKLDQIVAACDSWNESDHPRAEDGKFGSGGGSSSEQKASPKKAEAAPSGKSKMPFVNEFVKENPNREKAEFTMRQAATEKLNKLLELIDKHKLGDEDSLYVKELARAELKDRKRDGI